MDNRSHPKHEQQLGSAFVSQHGSEERSPAQEVQHGPQDHVGRKEQWSQVKLHPRQDFRRDSVALRGCQGKYELGREVADEH